MPFLRPPLVNKNDHKEGRHHKINSLCIKGHQAAQQAAEGGTHYPIDVIKHGYKKHKPITIHPFRRLGRIYSERLSHIPKMRYHFFFPVPLYVSSIKTP